MCFECGCDGNAEPHNHDDKLNHNGHEHPHRHVVIEQPILSANDRIAERNRGIFKDLGTYVLNIVSSPGSGKTAFLQKTIEALPANVRCGVVVGDLETDNDARRLRTTGAPVVQISTGTLCHLDAEMIAGAFEEIDLKNLDILFVENVGNLVCTSGFDLGESLRVALLSVAEGEDKPLKYPPLFRFVDVVVVSKTDLSVVCEFDRESALNNIRSVNPNAKIFEVSSKTGDGMEAWCAYLKSILSEKTKK